MELPSGGGWLPYREHSLRRRKLIEKNNRGTVFASFRLAKERGGRYGPSLPIQRCERVTRQSAPDMAVPLTKVTWDSRWNQLAWMTGGVCSGRSSGETEDGRLGRADSPYGCWAFVVCQRRPSSFGVFGLSTRVGLITTGTVCWQCSRYQGMSKFSSSLCSECPYICCCWFLLLCHSVLPTMSLLRLVLLKDRRPRCKRCHPTSTFLFYYQTLAFVRQFTALKAEKRQCIT